MAGKKPMGTGTKGSKPKGTVKNVSGSAAISGRKSK